MSRKHLRVLVLMHEDLVPPENAESMSEDEREAFKTEYDVVSTLRWLGHEVLALGVWDELAPLRTRLRESKPDVVFNLLEEFRGNVLLDHNVVSYLELGRTPYTGCSPRGLVLARDKALAKKILHYHRIPVPRFAVVPMHRNFRRPARMGFPLIVKSLVAEASAGISRGSVVHNDEDLGTRIRFIHDKVRTDAIIEEYIDGRELYVGVIGNRRLTVFPPWELFMDQLPPDVPRIATQALKFDAGYQKRHSITSGPAADLPKSVAERIVRVSKRIYRVLELTGYARLDFRLDAGGQLFFLEANPNPEIAESEEFAAAAEAAGFEYPQLLERIVRLGLRRGPGPGEAE